MRRWPGIHFVWASSLLMGTLTCAWAQSPRTAVPESCTRARNALWEELTWCGHDADLSLADLARNFAPILWFSPNEPLLRQKRADGRPAPSVLAGPGEIAIPHALPGDGDTPTVYYQVTEVFTDRKAPTCEGADLSRDIINLRCVTRLTLKYSFYYEVDIGANGHPEDLEGLELKLFVERNLKGRALDCRRIWLWRAKGLAHGLDWNANRLRILSKTPKADFHPGEELDRVRPPSSSTPRGWEAEDTLLPVSVLIEEGKHASCPDRNGDGAYTPGYDVNHRQSEAWGVRDNFGSGLFSGRFAAETTKPRDSGNRIFPPEIQGRNASRQFYEECSAPKRSWPPHSPHYDLHSAESGAARFGASSQLAHQHPGLARMITEEGLETTAQVDPSSHWFEWVSLNGNVSYRNDGREQWAGLLGGKRVLVGWLVPRILWTFSGGLLSPRGPHSVGGDLLFTPSAARWVDWYAVTASKFSDRRWQVLPEVGVKLRLTTKEIPLLGGLLTTKGLKWVQFIAVRVGLRLDGAEDGAADAVTKQGRHVKFVFELGGGAF